MKNQNVDSASNLEQGIYKICLGSPEAPVLKLGERSHIKVQEVAAEMLGSVDYHKTMRGFRVEMVLAADEEIFGFGLQLKSVAHKGTSKIIRPNADPVADTGDSHAPVPFFVSSHGYGVLLASYRNVKFHCGVGKNKDRTSNTGNAVTIVVEDLYEKVRLREPSTMVMDIPVADGVELYYFAADSVLGAVQLYNQFSGGGCMPPLWGLGPQFRCFARYTQQQVVQTALHLRKRGLACTMLGLEPGWQTHSYPCSLSWNRDRYPDPNQMAVQMEEEGFHLSLWEHAFLDPASPLYPLFRSYSGEYEVWKGIVPDLGLPEARKQFADYHRKQFVKLGIDGFKLDECDGSDYTGGWSYPDCTEFVSGLDGEQMHHAYGLLYQQAILEALGSRRTFSLVRNSGLCAAPYPFAIYSDLYGFEDFVRGNLTAGYCGLLWAPEVRDSTTKEDFIARLQLAVFSAFTLINGWYMQELPWDALDAEIETRELLALRMALLPYLYTAYYSYAHQGTPPVRAVPCDYGDDPQTYNLQDEYLLGPALLVAPTSPSGDSRRIYLPQGDWYDFWTAEPVPAGWREVSAQPIPVFVKGGSILPLAKPLDTILPNTVFELTPICYGDCKDAEFLLVEDDGETHDTEWEQLRLTQEGLARTSIRYRLDRFLATPCRLAPTYTRAKDAHR